MRVVIKLGGSVLTDERIRRSLIVQIAELYRHGLELVLVHGGGKQIARMLERLEIVSSFHDGLRVTDAETRDVAQMVLAGKVGKDLAVELSRAGIPAVGLAGGDGLSFLAEKIAAEDGTDLGFVGQITVANLQVLEALGASRVVPVIACLAPSASDGLYYNINGDQMAAAVAGAVQASHLVFVTDVGGVKDGNGRTIASLESGMIEELLASGVAAGGMRPKLRACLDALRSGVGEIRIIGGNTDRTVVLALIDLVETGTRIFPGRGVPNESEREGNERLGLQR